MQTNKQNPKNPTKQNPRPPKIQKPRKPTKPRLCTVLPTCLQIFTYSKQV